MEEDTGVLVGIGIVCIAILAITTIACGAYYLNHQLRVENFQKTIMDLSDEQKCIHICGFNYQGSVYLDQYKFCVEKCDRISEREQKCTT